MNAKREVVAAAAVQPRQNQTVLWIIAILLAIIATALIVRPNSPFQLQAAYGDSRMVGANGIFAFTGQIDRNSYGLFMMDVDNNNIWCYQYVPSTGKMRLVAARSFLYDKLLEDYNGGGPTVSDVQKMLDDQRAAQRRINGGGSGSSTAQPLNPADLSPETLGREDKPADGE